MSCPRFLTAAPHLRAVSFPAVTVVVDTHAGTVRALSGQTAWAWVALSSTGDSSAPVHGMPPAVLKAVSRRLTQHGFLVRSDRPRPWKIQQGCEPEPSWGTHVSPAALAAVQPAPWAWYPLAAWALLTTLALRQLGPRRRQFTRLQAAAFRRTRGRPADMPTAVAALRAVRRLSRWIPARAACLEESVAAVLALRVTGRSVTWRHGVATDPIRLHAWLEVDSRPVDEAPDIVSYTPILQE